MPTNYFYSVSDLLPEDKVPSELSVLVTSVQTILSELYYKDLVIEKSQEGHSAFLALTLAIFHRIELDLPADLKLVLFSSLAQNNTTASELPITFGYRWEILKYIEDFDATAFTGSGTDYYNILNAAANNPPEFLLKEIVNSFYENTAYDFYVAYNAITGINDLTLAVGTTAEQIEDYANQIVTDAENNGTNFYDRLYTEFLEGTSATETLENLATAFKSSFGIIDFNNLSKLLIPQVHFSVGDINSSINIALEFPRTMLIPLDVSGNQIVSPAKSQLTLEVGTIDFGTDTGIEFQSQLNITMDYSEIVGTGFKIAATGGKLDVSDQKNIAEADADGRPATFNGVYFSSIVLELPDAWTQATSGSDSLIVTDALIGSEGGFSGKIEIDPAGTNGILKFDAFNMTFSLAQFDVAFQQNAVVAMSGTGTVVIPSVTSAGNPAEIDVTISWDQTNSKYLVDIDTTNLPPIDLGPFSVQNIALSFAISDGAVSDFSLSGELGHDAFKDSNGDPVFPTFSTTYDGTTWSIAAAGLTIDAKGIPVVLNAFNFSFTSGGISSILLQGTMTLQNVEDGNGNAATIVIELAINGPDFYVSADYQNGLTLTIPNIVDFTLYKLTIGKEGPVWFIAFGTAPGIVGTYGAMIDVLLDIPVLSKFIPEQIGINSFRINSDASTQDEMLFMKWEAVDGMEVTASAGLLRVVLPLHLSILGVLDISGIVLQLADDPQGSSSILSITMSGSLALGPLTGSVKDVGVQMSIASADPGNFGPVNIGDYKIVPPSGMGMALEAPGFSGGGYFEYSEGEYAGALELTIYELVSVKAIGILTTVMPDGGKGFSLIIIISTEFMPGIQLGFGFALSGVGGLLSLNRTMVLDALREGVRDNSLDGFLFPDNPVKNAPKIISDMRVAFPVERGQFVFGPMAMLTWGTPVLISAELGVLVEVPNPFRLAILGVLKMVFPHEAAPALFLQVNFLGAFDMEAQLITFDASLYDSRLTTMTLDGDMAFRLGWGDNPVFLFSAGGFHPAFVPPPLSLSEMRRMRITLVDCDNIKLTVEAYFAATSNTVQFGARADLYARAIGFVAEAYLGYDVLLQFSPFYFIANVYGGADISIGGKSLFTVTLDFVLEGPEPYIAKGYAGFKYLGLKKEFRINESWGDAKEEVYEQIDLISLVKGDLEKATNWESFIDKVDGRIVYLRAIPDVADKVVMDPAGELTVRQKVVPLNTPIEKFGHQVPQALTSYNLLAEIGGVALQSGEMTAVKDEFAPAVYKHVQDSMKLSIPSFAKFDNGITLKPGGDEDFEYAEHFVFRQINFESKRIDLNENNVVINTGAVDEYKSFEANSPVFQVPVDSSDPETNRIFQYRLRGNAVANSVAGRSKKRYDTDFLPSQKVYVGEQGFVVVNEDDLTAYNSNAYANTYTEANDYLESLLAADPQLEGKLAVMPEFAHNI